MKEWEKNYIFLMLTGIMGKLAETPWIKTSIGISVIVFFILMIVNIFKNE